MIVSCVQAVPARRAWCSAAWLSAGVLFVTHGTAAQSFTVGSGALVTSQQGGGLDNVVGTVFADGTLRVSSAHAVDADDDLDLTVRMGSRLLGTLDGRIQVIGAGDFDGVNADKRARVTNNGDIIGLRDGVNINEDGTVINTGSITGGDEGVQAQPFFTLDNRGVITGGDNGVSVEGIGGAFIENGGTIRGTGDTGIAIEGTATIINNFTGGIIGEGDDGIDVDSTATITNNGLIDASGGDGGANSSEAITYAGGTLINNSSGAIRSTDNGIFVAVSTSVATPVQLAAATIINAGTIEAGLIGIKTFGDFGDTYTQNGGSLSGANVAINLFDGPDTFIIRGGVVNGSMLAGQGADGFELTGGTLNGTRIDGGDGPDEFIFAGASVQVGTVFGRDGVDTFTITGGTINSVLDGGLDNDSLTFTKLGSMTLNKDVLAIESVTLNIGTLMFNANMDGVEDLNILPNARLGGGGTITAAVTKLEGELDPGDGVGTLSLKTELLMTADASVLIQLVNPTKSDTLEIVGDVEMDGTLELAVLEPAELGSGYTIDIITANQINGRFASVIGDLENLGSLLVVRQLGDRVQLYVAVPGDTDGDGDIDDADLGTAFANYTGPLAPGTGGNSAADGDTDGDGDVDDADLGTAFSGYTGPLSPAAATNVPEPASLALVALGGLGLCRHRGGRFRG